MVMNSSIVSLWQRLPVIVRAVIAGLAVLLAVPAGGRGRCAGGRTGPHKDRNVIERCYCRLKDFRRIATRYDKLARNYFSALCLVAAVAFWL